MMEAEADWIAARLASLPGEALSPMLNIGSSDRWFRETSHPWIQAKIFAPLEARGVRVVHADTRAGDGIDLKSDIMSADGFRAAQEIGARSLLCTNVLEHVSDPAAFAARCQALVRPDGLILVTVPYSYPHHRDPIDTMFRPAPSEIAALFPDCRTVGEAVIATGSYRDNLRKRPWIIFRQIVRLPVPFLGWAAWKRSMMKFYWMVYSYRQSCVLLQKNA